MLIRHAVMHFVAKKPDGSPAALHLASSELPASGAVESLLHDVSHTYNAKTVKGWRFPHLESGAYPLSGWLSKAMVGEMTFINFTRTGEEHLTRLMEESSLAVGGHVLAGLTTKTMPSQLIGQLKRRSICSERKPSESQLSG